MYNKHVNLKPTNKINYYVQLCSCDPSLTGHTYCEGKDTYGDYSQVSMCKWNVISGN